HIACEENPIAYVTFSLWRAFKQQFASSRFRSTVHERHHPRAPGGAHDAGEESRPGGAPRPERTACGQMGAPVVECEDAPRLDPGIASPDRAYRLTAQARPTLVGSRRVAHSLHCQFSRRRTAAVTSHFAPSIGETRGAR